jgi:hypothetical protein
VIADRELERIDRIDATAPAGHRDMVDLPAGP